MPFPALDFLPGLPLLTGLIYQNLILHLLLHDVLCNPSTSKYEDSTSLVALTTFYITLWLTKNGAISYYRVNTLKVRDVVILHFTIHHSAKQRVICS